MTSQAFADFAAGSPSQAKKPKKEAKINSNMSLQLASNEQKRKLFAEAVRMFEKGVRRVEISERLGLGASWLSSYCRRLPATDPLRKRYKEVIDRRLHFRQRAERNAESVLQYMQEHQTSAKRACRALNVGYDSFYTFMAEHRDKPIHERYTKLKANALHWKQQWKEGR